MSNPNYNQIVATTLELRRKKLTNQVFMDFPLSFWLMEKGRTRMESGGNKIVEEIRHALGQAEFYADWDQFAIAPQTGISAAEYVWKQARASVAISGIEEAKNNGEAQVINLLEAKIDQAKDSLKSAFNTAFWGDGTGSGGKAFAGIKSYIWDAPSGAGTVGGIDQAANAYWRNQVTGVPGTETVITLADAKGLVNRVAEGANRPDLLVSNLALWEKVESLFTPNTQYRDVKAANAGFENITITGVTYLFDNGGAAPANRLYAINSEYITLVGHKDKWFTNSPFMDGTATAHASSGAANSVDGRYSVIYVYGNLVCSNRARQGVGAFKPV